jgi:hypothetical protein
MSFLSSTLAFWKKALSRLEISSLTSLPILATSSLISIFMAAVRPSSFWRVSLYDSMRLCLMSFIWAWRVNIIFLLASSSGFDLEHSSLINCLTASMVSLYYWMDVCLHQENDTTHKRIVTLLICSYSSRREKKVPAYQRARDWKWEFFWACFLLN